MQPSVFTSIVPAQLAAIPGVEGACTLNRDQLVFLVGWLWVIVLSGRGVG
jgi:hypothetical protein